MMANESIEFSRVIRAAIHAQQRFSEYQRVKAGIELNSRERLLIKILWLRKLRRLSGIPVTKLAAEYNASSLDRMKASESTISAVIQSLETSGFVTRVPVGKAIHVEIGEKGEDFIRKDEELMNERLEIYNKVYPEPSNQEIVKEFMQKVMEEFELRINSWRKGLDQ